MTLTTQETAMTATAPPMEPGERADRMLPIEPHERDWPECRHCGSGHIVRTGLRLACENCGERR